MPGPQPQHQFSLSHTIRIMLSCFVIAFCTVIPCRCRVGGSYGFAEGRDHPSLNPLSQDLALVYMGVIPSGTVSSPQPSCLFRWREVHPVRTSEVCDSHHSHHPSSWCEEAATSALRAGSVLDFTPQCRHSRHCRVKASPSEVNLICPLNPPRGKNKKKGMALKRPSMTAAQPPACSF